MLTAAVLFLSQAKEETETALKPTDRVGMNTYMRVCLLRGVVHAALEVSDLLWGNTENMQENHNLSEKNHHGRPRAASGCTHNLPGNGPSPEPVSREGVAVSC